MRRGVGPRVVRAVFRLARRLRLVAGRNGEVDRNDNPRDQHEQQRRRHGELHAPPLPLLGFPRHGHRPLALDRLQLLLDAVQVGHQSVGHCLAVRRSIRRARTQAVPAQCDQVRVRPAAVQPCMRLGQVGGPGTLDHLQRGLAGERRLAGQDRAQDTAQREHVGTGVGVLAAGLFGSHVPRRSQDCPHLRPIIGRIAGRVVVGGLVGVRTSEGACQHLRGTGFLGECPASQISGFTGFSRSFRARILISEKV
jgi:hypothetical protein